MLCHIYWINIERGRSIPDCEMNLPEDHGYQQWIVPVLPPMHSLTFDAPTEVDCPIIDKIVYSRVKVTFPSPYSLEYIDRWVTTKIGNACFIANAPLSNQSL